MPFSLPPGPRFALLQTYRDFRDPYGCDERMLARYGELFTMPTMSGTLVIVSSADGARELLVLREPMQNVSLEVIIRAVFGVSDGERVKVFQTAIREVVLEVNPALLFFRCLQRDLFGPWRRLETKLARADALIFEGIAAARRAGPEGRDDLLSRMIAARSEDGDGFSDSALRGFFRKVVTHGCAFRGHLLPKGTCLAGNILMIHRDPELYPDPLASRPERFLEHQYSPHEFLTFGGGHRRCIGAMFATEEIKLVLASMSPRIELERGLRRRPETVRRNGTLAPEGGVPVRVKTRT